MDIKETMIDFLLHQANDEQIEEFFGYAPHGFNREDMTYSTQVMPKPQITDIRCSAWTYDNSTSNAEGDADITERRQRP